MLKTIFIPLFCWLVGQGFKFLSQSLRHNRFELHHFLDLGGMPSTHSAMVASLATVVAYQEGVHSPVFGLSVIFAIFIIHDALRLRNLLQEHSKILNRLRLTLQPEEQPHYRILSEQVGHKLSEVIAGLAVGVILTVILMAVF